KCDVDNNGSSSDRRVSSKSPIPVKAAEAMRSECSETVVVVLRRDLPENGHRMLLVCFMGFGFGIEM
ncbi:hypothetical protein Tco_1137040, partial [Tanacetum coccineum]